MDAHSGHKSQDSSTCTAGPPPVWKPLCLVGGAVSMAVGSECLLTGLPSDLTGKEQHQRRLKKLGVSRHEFFYMAI